MNPQRLQRQRTRGWRAPDCTCGCGRPARYVGRGTAWGNPYRLVKVRQIGFYPYGYEVAPLPPWVTYARRVSTRQVAAASAVEFYREHYQRSPGDLPDLSPLAGHDLMCWCPLGSPCHADVLLSLANPELSENMYKSP